MATGKRRLYYDAMPQSPTSRPQESLDAWLREVVDWHFDPVTGTPFWLDFAAKAGWDPRREIRTFVELRRFGEFQDLTHAAGEAGRAWCR